MKTIDNEKVERISKIVINTIYLLGILGMLFIMITGMVLWAINDK